MTNEELKKKICDIIAPYVSAYGDDERIADALILEGIGYVWDITEKAEKAIASLIKQNKKLQHRAEVAERAVYNMAYGEWQREGARRAICEKYAPSTARDYLDRAEKELAEERKNDLL